MKCDISSLLGPVTAFLGVLSFLGVVHSPLQDHWNNGQGVQTPPRRKRVSTRRKREMAFDETWD
jgi:hypothetical protein